MKAAAAKVAVEAMLAGAPPDAAARQALAAVRRYGGEGGIIYVDATGRVGFAFNTPACHAPASTPPPLRPPASERCGKPGNDAGSACWPMARSAVYWAPPLP